MSTIGDSPPESLLASVGPREDNFEVRRKSLRLLEHSGKTQAVRELLEAAAVDAPSSPAPKDARRTTIEDSNDDEDSRVGRFSVRGWLLVAVTGGLLVFAGLEFVRHYYPSSSLVTTSFDFWKVEAWRSLDRATVLTGLARLIGTLGTVVLGSWVGAKVLPRRAIARHPGLSEASAKEYSRTCLHHVLTHLFLCFPIALSGTFLGAWLLWRWILQFRVEKYQALPTLLSSTLLLVGGCFLEGAGALGCWIYWRQFVDCRPKLRRVGTSSYEIGEF